ncbi:MAG: hypothetical protein F6J89_16425 [Symploca sp. SIO1C4]|uniref:Uncharacterized protein n=1 Tax=Symploca sp. SIO1C4 TaxID=2607765 RepID=A0A6B3N7S4_9CYAN|nr:hypothetical protein [Symploca sp. SIO1C4]
MVAYAQRKGKKSQYLTADTETGEKILNYMKKRCEKALAYCIDQQLTTVEDFAEALEQLTQVDGKPGISVELSRGGLTLTMTDHPELGSTTGKYMMQHLGFDEEEQKRFTVAGIESILNPEKSKSKSQELDSLLDDLGDAEPAPKSKSKSQSSFQKNEEIGDLLNQLDESEKTGNELDDLLDQRGSGDKPKKSQKASKIAPTQSPTRAEQPPQKKPNIGIDDILDSAAQISAQAARQSSEVDGTTIGGISTQAAFLAAIVGKKSAQAIIKTAKETGQKRQLAQIITRLKAQSERADELAERADQLSELTEEAPLETEAEEAENKEGQETESAGEALVKAVNQVHDKINQTDISENKNDKIEIDKNASFQEQLAQITAALDRIDQRLDNLENRIEALEGQMIASNVSEGQKKHQETKTLTTDIEEIVDEPFIIFTAPETANPPPKTMLVQTTNQKENLAVECASTLLNLYNNAEKEAIATGETIEDGVVLGEEAILYATKDGDSVTVSLETYSGEELFSAVQKEQEWQITNDLLSDEDQKTIINLPKSLEEAEAQETEPETPTPAKKRQEMEM